MLLKHSVGNKYTAICGEIIDRSIQVCLLTETWHTAATDTAMRRCIPSGYALYDVPRPSDGSSQNHGGLAAIVSSVYKYRAITPPYAPATFESMAFTLTGSPSSSTAVLLIYRPGSAMLTNSFFVELTAYLEAMSMFKCPLIIAGDFNIHIEDEDGGNARKLMDLLHSFDCSQRVVGQTHRHGGTLDHVWTRSDETVINLTVDPPDMISDHSLITWQIPFPRQRLTVVNKSVRSWKKVDRRIFRQSIIDSELCNLNPENDADTMFATYDRVLRELSEKFAPSHKTTIRRHPIAVWYDDESRMLRRKSRALERRYRRTHLATDRLQWIQQEKVRHKANLVKENSYWLCKLSENAGQPRKLWKIFSSAMGLDRVADPPIGSPTAQNHIDYFLQKIETIRMSTGGSQPTTRLQPPTVEFNTFKSLSSDEIRTMIMSTKSKSCSLDPIPIPSSRSFCRNCCRSLQKCAANRSPRDGCQDPSGTRSSLRSSKRRVWMPMT